MLHRFVFLFAGLMLTASVAAGDRDALWKIAHDQCMPDERAHGNPAPCARVYLDDGPNKGYVILKDRVGVAQYLLIATRKISGIESPDLFGAGLAQLLGRGLAKPNLCLGGRQA